MKKTKSKIMTIYLLFFKRNLSAKTMNITVKIILKNSVSFILEKQNYFKSIEI